MPIYEYECKNCHHQFDLIQKMSDAPAKECPQCHKDTAVRLVSAAGFQLKGTGWYATDFKNKGKPAEKSNKSEDGAAENKTKEQKSTDGSTGSTSSTTGDKD